MRGRTLTRPPTEHATAVMPPSDAAMIAAARTDPHAFAPLYRRYVDPVYRYCYRRLGDPETAADATSQVFVNAIAALPGYRDDAGSFRYWLFAIAHNVVIDEVRTIRWTSRMTTLEAATELAGTMPSLEDDLVAGETARSVRVLLRQLTTDQRHVLELRLAGLTGPEIAAALGKSLGSVKIAQVRAFARLRGVLADGTGTADANEQDLPHDPR